MDVIKVSIEFSLHEAEVIRRALQNYSPPKEDELISIMLFSRIKSKIAEAAEKNE